jgi:hypothetical protein
MLGPLVEALEETAVDAAAKATFPTLTQSYNLGKKGRKVFKRIEAMEQDARDGKWLNFVADGQEALEKLLAAFKGSLGEFLEGIAGISLRAKRISAVVLRAKKTRRDFAELESLAHEARAAWARAETGAAAEGAVSEEEAIAETERAVRACFAAAAEVCESAHIVLKDAAALESSWADDGDKGAGTALVLDAEKRLSEALDHGSDALSWLAKRLKVRRREPTSSEGSIAALGERAARGLRHLVGHERSATEGAADSAAEGLIPGEGEQRERSTLSLVAERKDERDDFDAIEQSALWTDFLDAWERGDGKALAAVFRAAIASLPEEAIEEMAKGTADDGAKAARSAIFGLRFQGVR